MTISAAIVVFAVTWFMVLFCVLPLNLTTQGEAGSVVPGTHSSAPSGAVMAQKARVTTLVALVIWAIIVGVVWSDLISVRDFDWFNRMPPESATQP